MLIELKVRILKKFGTQADFARAVDEHESFVSRVIRGRSRLSAEKKGKWSKVLGCKHEELFREPGK